MKKRIYKKVEFSKFDQIMIDLKLRICMILHADSESDLKTSPNQVKNPILSKNQIFIPPVGTHQPSAPTTGRTNRLFTLLGSSTPSAPPFAWEPMGPPAPPWVLPSYRRGNLSSKCHQNRIFNEIWFLSWFGLVLRSDSELA